MQIRLATNSDEKNWNLFTSQHPKGSPYHHYGWKKSVEKAYGHRCYYLIAENSKHEITGILPTVSIKPPLLPGKLCSLPFCDLGAALAINEKAETLLIDEAKKLATTHKLTIFEYRDSEQQIQDEEQLKLLSSDHKVRMLLDLPDTSESLMASFKSKLRSQIRKAEKNGLTVELGHSDKLVEDFYDVFSCNMKDLGSPTHSQRWFTEITRNYCKNMIISIVRHEELAIGAGIVLFNGNKASIPWASTKREFNRLSPNMLLYWSLLEYTTDQGYKSFDFGRSSFGEGTFKFKQQWGAKPVPLKWKTFGESHSNDSEKTDTETNTTKKSQLRPIIESIWRQLPLTATTAIGPKLRKYISL